MSDEPSLGLGGSVGDIPGYEIESELGRGGFSRVFLARQPRLHRTVAVKVLTHIEASDTEAHRRFEAECQAVGSLSWHPHVVTVYDTGTTTLGHPFLAMEHLPGGSLQARLDDHGAAPWQEVVRVGTELADALAAAHQAGILHRDVKPANVLADRLGDHRLADFGIARFGDATRTATGVITGTAAYTAPEVLRGDRATPVSDLYSLGATLHALLVGRAPFLSGDDESVMAVMYRVASLPPGPLDGSGAPPSFTGLVLSLMAKDPAARPASAVDVGRWLQQVQRDHGLPVTTLRAASSQPPPPGTAASAGPRPGPTTPEPATLPPLFLGAPAAPASPSPASLPPPPLSPPPGASAPSPAGRTALVVAAAVVVLLLAAGGFVAFLLTQDDDDRAAPDPTTTSAATPVPPSTEEPATTDPLSTLVPTSDPDTTLPTGYTEENREQFIESCTAASGNEAQCICVIDRIEAEVPFDVYLDLAANPLEGLPPQIQGIVEDCSQGG